MTAKNKAYVAARFPFADDIFGGLRYSGLPLSAALAVLTMETHGANVFGHDPVRRGQVVGGRVTQARYKLYKARRRLGWGNQGVGPCQLTGTGLQDGADARGGCWKPLHNMEIGFAYLAGLHMRWGSWAEAFEHYNGSGDAAEHYGRAAAALMKHYHEELI